MDTAYGERPKTHLPLAIAAIIAAALLYATIGAFVKYLSKDLTVEGMAFWRNFVCLVAVIPWLLFQGGRYRPLRERIKTSKFSTHLVRSLSGLAAIYLYFASLQFLSLADALLLANTIPIFVPITAYFWKSIPIIHKLWWGLGIAFAGIILIIQPGLGVFNPASFIALAGAVSGSVATLALRFAHYHEPPARTLFYYFLISSIVGLLATLPRFTRNWIDLTGEGLVILILIGVLGMLYQLCFTYAFKWAPVRLVSPFLFLSVVFSMVLQHFIWNAPVLPYSILGFILVFFGALLTVLLYPKHLR